MRLHRLIGTFVLCLAPLGATAQTAEENANANAKTCGIIGRTTPPPPAQRIQACTWLLESGWLSVGANTRDEVARRYLQAYQKRAQAYAQLAQNQSRSGKREQASANFDRAIADYTTMIARHAQALGPQYVAELLGTRGQTYAMKGDIARAIADYTQAIKTPDLRAREAATLHLLRGEAYRQQGNYDDAVADHAKAVELVPHPANDVALALSRYHAGQYGKAVRDAKRALTRDDMYEPAVNVLAHALVALGAREQALLQFERAMLLGGPRRIQHVQFALAGHGYEVERTGRYDPATYQALKACVEAGCRLLE